jgi:regulator of protease activity HflC (stomatin/prohibitin superfamily)
VLALTLARDLPAAFRWAARAQVKQMRAEENAAASKLQSIKRGKDARDQVRAQREAASLQAALENANSLLAAEHEGWRREQEARAHVAPLAPLEHLQQKTFRRLVGGYQIITSEHQHKIFKSFRGNFFMWKMSFIRHRSRLKTFNVHAFDMNQSIRLELTHLNTIQF